MDQHALQPDRPPRRNRLGGLAAPNGREGAISALLIVAMLLALACLALAYDIACITQARQELRSACEASALAGASQLMDDSFLYRRSATLSSSGDALKNGRRQHQFVAAQHMAADYAGRNRVSGRPLKLKLTSLDPHKRDGESEVILGWSPDSTRLDAGFHPDAELPKINAMQVQVKRGASHIPPLVSRMYGSRYTLHCVTRASVDQQVYGFRPTVSTPAPMLPLLLEFRDPLQEWKHRSGLCDYAGCEDRYRVDPRTGKVTRGKDGIPEYVFRLGPTRSSRAQGRRRDMGRLRSIPLGKESSSNFMRQFNHGLAAQDLESLGGEFALDRHGRRGIVTRNDSHGSAAKIAAALRAIRGQQRVIPWGASQLVTSERQRNLKAEARGFLAARVVDVDSSGSIEVTLQPCVMQTGAALLRSGEPQNAWVGKLVLNR